MSSKKFRLAIYSKCMESRTSPTIFDTETDIACRNRSKADYPFMTDALLASSLGNGSPTATVIRILYTPTRSAVPQFYNLFRHQAVKRGGFRQTEYDIALHMAVTSCVIRRFIIVYQVLGRKSSTPFVVGSHAAVCQQVVSKCFLQSLSQQSHMQRVGGMDKSPTIRRQVK